MGSQRWLISLWRWTGQTILQALQLPQGNRSKHPMTLNSHKGLWLSPGNVSNVTIISQGTALTTRVLHSLESRLAQLSIRAFGYKVDSVKKCLRNMQKGMFWEEKKAGNLNAVPDFPSLCYFYRMGRMLWPTAQGPWRLLVTSLLRPGLSNSNPTFTLTCLMAWLVSQSIPGPYQVGNTGLPLDRLTKRSHNSWNQESETETDSISFLSFITKNFS